MSTEKLWTEAKVSLVLLDAYRAYKTRLQALGHADQPERDKIFAEQEIEAKRRCLAWARAELADEVRSMSGRLHCLAEDIERVAIEFAEVKGEELDIGDHKEEEES